jgi:hypothetical protein
MGKLVPLLAIGISLLILAGATRQQLLGGAAALAVGAGLFLANDRFGRQRDARFESLGVPTSPESDAV